MSLELNHHSDLYNKQYCLAKMKGCNIDEGRDEEFFLGRIVSNPIAKSSSSRIYYGPACGQVPFEWESRPGKPKIPPEAMLIPPLSPPPATESAHLAHRRSSGGRVVSEQCNCSICNSSSSSSSATISPQPPFYGCFLKPMKVAMLSLVKRWVFTGAHVCLLRGGA